LEYLGGVPRAIVPDNLKAGVQRAHRYEPQLNPAYQEFAEHYGVAVLPARVRRPRDKAKVEAGVLIVERWILACLRHRVFFSLGELNAAIRDWLERLNGRPFKKLDGCRRSRFEAMDQPALRPLPARAYEFAEWRQAKVHPDYHIEVGRAYYSVPYRFIGQRVDVRLSAPRIEVFQHGTLIAVHARSTQRAQRATRAEHRPGAHRAIIERSLERVLQRAATIGPATVEVIRQQAAHRKHPEETLRSAQGILRLARDFSPADLERACERACAIATYSYRSVRQLIQVPAPEPAPPAPDLFHDNVRGAAYFQ
jgi:transposase